MGQGLMRFAAFVVLAGVVSVVMASYVGDLTVYSQEAAGARLQAHEWIVGNQQPPGGWDAHGMNGTNIRIGVPYLAEAAHSWTGAPLLRIYKGIDVLCIWLGLVAFFYYLRSRFDARTSGLAWLYWCAVMPLTFATHFFQPWDRVSFLLWVMAIWFAREQRFLAFAVTALVATAVKYDAVVLPAFYFLANASWRSWRRPFMQCAVLGTALLGLFILLRQLIPGGFEPRDYRGTILSNLANILDNPVTYAPFLAFGIPILLGLYGYRAADQFGRAGLWFALFVLSILFVSTHFEEVRAEQMIIPLLAPIALTGLTRLLGRSGTATTTQAGS